MVTKMNQKGFTLIELSIVLVLIGLIIGGVLKGQELITSTRLKMTVSQWDAVKSAVNSFQDKYVAIPGDYSQASNYISSSLTDGDGNGIIGAAVATDGMDEALTSAENGNTWKHLQASGFLSSADISGAGVLPAKVPSASFHFLVGTFGTRTAHWLRLQSGSNPATAPANDPLSPSEAAEIDRKYDDEDFTSGSIQAAKVGSATGTCNAANISSDTKLCTLVFELF